MFIFVLFVLAFVCFWCNVPFLLFESQNRFDLFLFPVL